MNTTYQTIQKRAKALEDWFQSEGSKLARGTYRNVVDHIDHIVKVAGIDHVGIGSDFDGISMWPEGLDDVSSYPRLTEELLRRGYSETDVHKILGGNVLRAFRQAGDVAERLRATTPPQFPRPLSRVMTGRRSTRPPRRNLTSLRGVRGSGDVLGAFFSQRWRSSGDSRFSSCSPAPMAATLFGRGRWRSHPQAQPPSPPGPLLRRQPIRLPYCRSST